MSLRILYFAPPGPHSRKFVRTFASGHEVLAVTQFARADAGWVSFSMSRLGRWVMSANAARLRRVIDEWKPDIVHAFHILPSGVIAARTRFRPLVISAMGADVYGAGGQVNGLAELVHRTPLPWLWHRRVRGAFDLALVECEDVRDRMASMGYESGLIKTIPWGPDCSQFTPDARDEAVRDSLLPRGTESLLICTRQHRRVYGVEAVVRALARMPRTTGLVLCGSGPLTPHLMKLAERLGVRERVNWLGERPQEDLPAILASCDLAISLASSDTISVSVLEAMACGLPVVVRAVGGTREFVNDGASGYCIADGSPERASAAVARVLGDATLARRMGAAARAEVLEKADWRKCSVLIDAEYKALAETRAAAQAAP